MKDFKYSFKSNVRENLGLTVYNSGIQQCPPMYCWGPAIRDHFLIHYIMSGEGTFTVDTRTYKLRAGQFFIIYPSQAVSYYADEYDPWEYAWVGFNGIEAERLLQMTDFSRENPIISYNDNTKLREHLLDIYNSSGSAAFNESKMTGYLYLFLSSLISMSETSKRSSYGNPAYIEKALRFIQYNYSNDISVEDIATSVGLSRSHLHRIFVQNLSVSPNEFLTKFRINKACSLLKNSELSINSIANSVGFSDPLYFSRVFKKVKGTPPSQYISSQKQEKTQEVQNEFFT